MTQELRREERHSCALPGLLKLMRPEDTFTPLRLPVLILDISPIGALIRLHPTALKMPLEEVRQRGFSLKVANASLPAVRGTVAWSHRTDDLCLIGLEFSKECPEVRTLAERGAIGKEESSVGIPSVPLLYPYKTYCEEPLLRVEGEAYRATEIVIRNDDGKELVVPVENAFFRCELPLVQNSENRFFLCAANHVARSPDVEISVICAPDAVRNAYVPRASYRVVRTPGEGAPSLQLSFNGSPEGARELLQIITELTKGADQSKLEVRLTTNREFEAVRLKNLARKLQNL